MNTFRVEKGTVTIPIEELNRLEDLNLKLKEKELNLKQREAKFQSEMEIRIKELDEREATTHRLIEEKASIVIAMTEKLCSCGCGEVLYVEDEYTILDEDLKSKILTNKLEVVNSYFVTNFDKLKFLKRLDPKAIYKCFTKSVEQATGIELCS